MAQGLIFFLIFFHIWLNPVNTIFRKSMLNISCAIFSRLSTTMFYNLLDESRSLMTDRRIKVVKYRLTDLIKIQDS